MTNRPGALGAYLLQSHHGSFLAPSIRRVAESVAEAVANAAVASGVARRERGGRTYEPATPLEALQ